MKQCPTCKKTFDDSMRFCQIDGTPLIEAGGGEDERISAPESNKTTVGSAQTNDSEDDDILQLHDEAGATKPIFGAGNLSGGGELEINFGDLDVGVKNDASPGSSRVGNSGSENNPSFGDSSASQQSNVNPTSSDSQNQSPFGSVPPLSSPFDQLSSSASTGFQPPSFQEPEQGGAPNFGSAQTPFNQSPFEQTQNPFGGQPLEQTQWTPPPSPEADWQNQSIGANTPFQPPMVGQGQDKTLATVSLVCGILSLTCCGPVTGIAALITGYMAKNNVDSNPQQYTGRGFALTGMIMGGISMVLTVLYFIFVVVLGVIGR